MEPSTQQKRANPRVGYSVASLAAASDLSRQTLYREIEEGRLRVKRVRGRIVIPAEAVTEWLNSGDEPGAA